MTDIYYNPVRTYQGDGCLELLPEMVEAVCPGRNVLLLVWDESVLGNGGIAELCRRLGSRLVLRQFAASNPEIGQLYEMYTQVRGLDIGLVVAVGGGSVLDVGKSLCCLFGKELTSVEELRRMIADKAYGQPACRWIGVPTTAGTGSEVTCWATIWDTDNQVKYSVDTPENYAWTAVVDPQLTASMPLGLAVSSALDAVAHAAESYWAKSSNAASRALALAAIRTIMADIDCLADAGHGRQACDAMSRGSMLAGLAFSNTRTTACHSISYPLTMQCHIPHGVAVSLLLGPVLELNLPAVCEAGALLAAFGVDEPQQVGERINAILTAAGHPVRLRDWGATMADLPELVAHSITKGRADNNPVELTEDVVADILRALL